MLVRTALEQLIARGDTKEAIEIYLACVRHYQDDERLSAGLLQSGKYHSLLEQNDEGVLGRDDFRVEMAQIQKAMVGLIAEIPPNWTLPAGIALPVDGSAKKNVAKPSGVWLWALGIIFLVVVMIWGVKILMRAKNARQKDQSETQSSVQVPIPKKDEDPSQTESGSPSKDGKAEFKFRSFANPIRSEDMELGFILDGQKKAFRNLRTAQILCCYDEARPFSKDRALVQQQGRSFYIDKNGKEVSK